MRLDQELVRRGLCESRSLAQVFIARGCVQVDGAIVTKQAKDVAETDTIELAAVRMFVSRGGEKLEGAIVRTGITVKGKVALDIGSSTGGFTDCLLAYGARKVVAVDVGSDQLHRSLRENPKVELHEETDIRNFESTEAFDLIVGDVSFISLDKIISSIIRLSDAGTEVLCLIKPQFEVGKGNTKKGIVKDESLHETVLSSIEELFIKNGFGIREIFPSPIVGGDGNREFFIYALRR